VYQVNTEPTKNVSPLCNQPIEQNFYKAITNTDTLQIMNLQIMFPFSFKIVHATHFMGKIFSNKKSTETGQKMHKLRKWEQ